MRSERYGGRLSRPSARRGRNRSLAGIGCVLALAASGCSAIQVESLRSPGANFAGATTFRILEEPAEAPAVRVISLDDRDVEAIETVSPASPALNNPIIDEMVRDDVARAFERRGYAMTGAGADLNVAYRVQAREQLEVEAYPSRYGYRRGYVEERTEATVVIDVLDPDTDRLLWRGTGEMTVSDDPREYAKQLNEAVGKIVRRFPAAVRYE